MDIHTPDHHPSRAEALSGVLFRRLLHALAAGLPDSLRVKGAPVDEDRAAVMELFEAFDPSSAAETQLAAITIAASFSAMDSFVRAMRADVSEPTAACLCGSGLIASRALGAALQALHLLRKPPEAPAAARRAPPHSQPDPLPTAAAEIPPGHIALLPGAAPIPLVETFQPRDRFGKPIPLHRTGLMTRAQLLATLTCPRDPALEAAAIAEEEEMIAEQAGG